MKITWNDIVRKLTSRKLWVTVAGLVTAIALIADGDASEIQRIAGAILAVLNALGYVGSEAYVDGKNKTDNTANVTAPEGNE